MNYNNSIQDSAVNFKANIRKHISDDVLKVSDEDLNSET